MKKDHRLFLLELVIHAAFFAAAFFHLILHAFLRWFIPITKYQQLDYALGVIAIAIAVLLSLFLAVSLHYFRRFRIGHLFLIVIMGLYIWSCFSLQGITHNNEFDENKLILYDTIVLFFFCYPLGHYVARWKNPVFFKVFLNIILLVCSILMIVVMSHVLKGESLEMPTGNFIYMKPWKQVYRLEIAFNANTTGLIESTAFLTSLALLFWNRTVAGKALAAFSLLVNYSGLVLSGSRTSWSTAVLGGLLIIFFYVLNRVSQMSEKKARAVTVSLVYLIAVFVLQQGIQAYSSSIYDHQDASASVSPVVQSLHKPAQHEQAHMTDESAEYSLFAAGAPQGLASVTENTALNFFPELYNGVPDIYMHPYMHFYKYNTDSSLVSVALAQSEKSLAAADASSQGVLYKKLDNFFSGRLHIWGYAMKAITKSPQTIRHGVTPGHIFSAMDEAAGRRIKLYTHNQFLEVALALGIPALIVFIGFFFYTIYNAVTLFRYTKYEPLSIVTPVFLLVFILANMTEATLLFHRIFSSYVFFFVCGWINERGILIRNHLRRRQARANGRAAVRTRTSAGRNS